MLMLHNYITPVLVSVEDSLVVRNFQSGLVSVEGNQAVLYNFSNKLTYEENSRCLVEDNAIGCMRFGFQFDWESELDRIVLNCSTFTSNRVREHADDGDMGDATNVTNFEIELEGRNGTYVHPRRYFNYGSKKYRNTLFKTQCYLNESIAVDSTTELIENPI